MTPYRLLPRHKQDGARPIYTDEHTAFVKGLPYTCNEDDVRAVFSACGEVKGVRFVRDRETGKFKGFGCGLAPSSAPVWATRPARHSAAPFAPPADSRALGVALLQSSRCDLGLCVGRPDFQVCGVWD